MANEIENIIRIYGNAEVMAFWQNYVTELAAAAPDERRFCAFLWPDHDFASLDLIELTGTKWFVLAADPYISATDCDLYIKSAWGPCDKYVWRLYQQLAAIDPAVVVKNIWTDDDDGYLTGVLAYFAKDGLVYQKEVELCEDELALVTDYDDDNFFDVKFDMRDRLFDAAIPEVVGPQVQIKQ
jgi:hypothetical protein